MITRLKTWLLLYVLALSTACSMAADSSADDSDEPLRVCILSGCKTYKSEQSLPPFEKWLEENYHVRCTHLARKGDDDLPGLEALDRCDVALIFFKRMNLRDEQLKRFQDYVLSGRPIVAVRTASHAVQTWLEFDAKVLGGNYQGHGHRGIATQIEVLPAGKQHPVLAGVKLTTAPGPLYRNAGHAQDIEILMTGAAAGHTEPIAWTRELQGGRIFYTSLGNVETFEQPDFRRMLANALFWTARREP